MTAIDTTKVMNRRKVRYETIKDLLEDIDQVVEAESRGALVRLGNWSPGQIFGHLASWIEYGYNGYPMTVPWVIRIYLRAKLKSYLHDGMSAGVKIPRIPNGTYATDDAPTQAAADRLRNVLGRLKRGEPAKFDSPAFGKMTEEKRVALNLRHAELHMSFLAW